MTKSKLTLDAAIATAMLTSSAFAAFSDRNSETILQPNSPVATGGGSLGYNVSQENVDRGN